MFVVLVFPLSAASIAFNRAVVGDLDGYAAATWTVTTLPPGLPWLLGQTLVESCESMPVAVSEFLRPVVIIVVIIGTVIIGAV